MGSKATASITPSPSFFATLKKDLLCHRSFATRQDARTAVFDYIEAFYNPVPLHSTLGYRSPIEYERSPTMGKLPNDNVSIQPGAVQPSSGLEFRRVPFKPQRRAEGQVDPTYDLARLSRKDKNRENPRTKTAKIKTFQNKADAKRRAKFASRRLI